jgi:cyclic pyranopterin phosphate synthase
MLDHFNRTIDHLRISVTDRCNLRCRYCMPEEGPVLISRGDLLSFREIVEIVKVGVKKGISHIRLTGGEPLVRKGIVTLVTMLTGVEGVREVSMTTNGILLENYAVELAKAGLRRVNISLDTIDTEKYRDLTRGGDVTAVLRGIDAAEKAGLTPVKLNCVVWNSSDEPNARAVADFAEGRGLKVQFIHQMDLETGQFSRVEGGNGGNCLYCNRLRITANGYIKPCLFNSKGFSIREYGISEAFQLAVDNKPREGTVNKSGKFYNIGG